MWLLKTENRQLPTLPSTNNEQPSTTNEPPLRHTFSEKNFVTLPQGSTGIMDFSTEKYALLKPSFNETRAARAAAKRGAPVELIPPPGGRDLIHHPQTTTGLMDGMEEGASQEIVPTKEAKWEKFTGDITAFISPAGLPITIPKIDSVLIAHGPSTYQSTNGKVYDIPSAENVLIAFKLENGVTYVPYISGNNGENIFYGYITDPSKMDFFEDSQTASLPASFSVKLLEGASPVIKQCQIKPEQVFADAEYAQYNPNSKYRAAGPMAYRINDVSLKAGGFYYSKYRRVSLFENCNVLKVAIEKDPYVLRDITAIGEGLGYETQFMKELKQAVMVGTAAAFTPVLIVMVEMVGAEIVIKETTKQLAKGTAKRFFLGATTSVLGNITANMFIGKNIGDEDYPWKDIALDAFIAGTQEVAFPSEKWGKALMNCAEGLNIETVLNLIKARTHEDLNNALRTAGIECLVPVVVGSIGERLVNKALQTKYLSRNGFKFFKERLNFGNTQTGELLFNSLNLNSLMNGNKANIYKQVLSKQSGADAMDILLESQFNPARLSGRNFERLSNIVERCGETQREALVRLLKENKDASRMLVFLDKISPSPEEYAKAIKAIEADDMFSKTITLNGKTQKFSDFFDTPGDAFEYYHKVEGNTHYFAKIENGEGILIKLERVGNYFTSTAQSYIKDKAEKYYEVINDSNLIIISDEQ